MFTRMAMLLGLCASAALGDNYAVLVAGSAGYGNYRHQADIAHAYQVLTKGGVRAENIITFMYDDVAGSSENPFPGKLYNKPTSGKGWDVYEGVKVDYKGEDATAANFMAVLTGDSSKTGGKKVLQTTSADRVFVNFADHGGPGIVAFPAGPFLQATDLVSTLKTMHTKQMYKELVFYMEACESGSMFPGLPADIGIYAVTAANADESSWGTYCPPNDVVDGTPLNSCLGDLWSVNWMENADSTDLRSETLQEQYTKVKALTTKSHSLQFGQLSLTVEDASTFEGRGNVHPTNATKTETPESQGESQGERQGHVDSRDIGLVTAYWKYVRATEQGAKRTKAALELIAEIESRERSDALFAGLERAVTVNARVETVQQLQPACYKAAHEALRQCGAYNDYSMKYTKTTKMLCDSTNGATSQILAAIAAVCPKH